MHHPTWLLTQTVSIVLGLLLAGANASAAQAGPPASAASPPAAAAPQQQPIPPSGPQIDFGSNTFNFGKVQSGEVVKHDFVFTNTGGATLEVLDVRPGCGCTTAGAWDKKVEPGKTGNIPLQFNSSGFSGPVGKYATVTCNDPAHSNIVLTIAGTVWKPIDITPSMAMFNLSSEVLSNETKVLRIVSNLEEPVTLSDLQCNSASFKTELKETKPGKEFDLHVTAVPPFVSPTVFAAITLRTSSTQAPMLSVTAYAVVQQAVSVSPQQLILPVGPLKTPFSSSLMVRNSSSNALEVSDARLDAPGVEVKVIPAQTGQVYTVAVTFPAGFQIQPGQNLELTAKTSHPQFALLKVPVLQSQPVAAAPPPPAQAPGFPIQLQTASPLRPRPALGPSAAKAPANPLPPK
jgi:hypothetical protein